MIDDSRVVAGIDIDIGKTWLDVACHPSGSAMRVENTPARHERLVAWLRAQAAIRVGLEAGIVSLGRL